MANITLRGDGYELSLPENCPACGAQFNSVTKAYFRPESQLPMITVEYDCGASISKGGVDWEYPAFETVVNDGCLDSVRKKLK